MSSSWREYDQDMLRFYPGDDFRVSPGRFPIFFIPAQVPSMYREYFRGRFKSAPSLPYLAKPILALDFGYFKTTLHNGSERVI